MADEANRILTCILVDDDAWALTGIRRSLPLEETGYEVVGEYNSAQDALEGIHELRPDLVVTDICMGSGSGLDLLETCRTEGLPCRFILVSGYSDFEYARRAIKADVSGYLLKPIDYNEAKDALKKVRSSLEGKVIRYEFPQNTIEQIGNFIRENYQSSLSLDELAGMFHLNRTYLSELFREKMGKTFVQYKNEVRVEHAKMLLNDTQKTISEIATLCGFDNISYFALVFKQIVGVPPKEYRRNIEE